MVAGQIRNQTHMAIHGSLFAAHHGSWLCQTSRPRGNDINGSVGWKKYFHSVFQLI